jgi:hypothetical protein
VADRLNEMAGNIVDLRQRDERAAKVVPAARTQAQQLKIRNQLLRRLVLEVAEDVHLVSGSILFSFYGAAPA